MAISDSDEDSWASRRDLSFRLPWEMAVVTVDGIPYLGGPTHEIS